MRKAWEDLIRMSLSTNTCTGAGAGELGVRLACRENWQEVGLTHETGDEVPAGEGLSEDPTGHLWLWVMKEEGMQTVFSKRPPALIPLRTRSFAKIIFLPR